MSGELPKFFPYLHSGEPDLPRYMQFRAEGLSLSQAVWGGLSYLRKWRNPKTTAPLEELRYFNHQRQLVRALAAEPAGDGVRLALVGDLMWLKNSWDYFLDKAVLDYLNAHDVVLGNLESPISPRFPVPSLLPDYLTYNSDPRLVTSFVRPDGTSTFTALATCNNHSLDRGDEGLLDTLSFLDAQGIRHAGVRREAKEASFATWSAGGVSFGFYAACWGLNNPKLIDSTKLHIEIIPGLAPRVRHPFDLARVQLALFEMELAGIDFKIVKLHWGHEFEFYPCPDLMLVGREIIRAGADVVVGSHPHVVQPMEVCFVNGYEADYLERWPKMSALEVETGCILEDPTGLPRKGLIVYSLGNFASVMFATHCRIGMALGLEVRPGRLGRADWFCPSPRFIYNAPRDEHSRKHRLVLLEDYLKRQSAATKQNAKLREMASFVREHVLGNSEPRQ